MELKLKRLRSAGYVFEWSSDVSYLSRAIAMLQTLPESEQNAIASMILDEARTSDAGMKPFRDRQILLKTRSFRMAQTVQESDRATNWC